MSKAKAVYEFLPIYDRHVFYGNDLEEIKAEILLHFKESEVDLSLIDHPYAHGLTAPVPAADDDEKIQAFVMYILDSSDIGTVTHEAVHLTNQIFYYLGQELDPLNDEAQAYLTGYLAKVFMEKIRGEKEVKRVRKKKNETSKTKI